MRNDNLFFVPKLPADLNQGLVAYYSFDSNNANDLVGGNNGTLIGSPTFTSGINNDAIDFGNDSVVKYVNIADSNTLSFTSGGGDDIPFSFSFWINIYSYSSTGSFIVCKRNSSQLEYHIHLNNSGFLNFVKFSNSATNYQAKQFMNSLDLNTWYHVVITDSGNKIQSEMNAYIDSIIQSGTNYQSGTYTGMVNTNANVFIGIPEFLVNGNTKTKGIIDELAIWKNRELTQSEVTELYNSGIGKFYPF